MSTRTVHEQEAYDMGRDAALAAASWIVDGNTKREAIPAVLALIDDGDPRADDYLPARPDLSGEWADSPTPSSLAEDILGPIQESEGYDDPYVERELAAEALADAFEEGVSDHFENECERILRASLSTRP